MVDFFLHVYDFLKKRRGLCLTLAAVLLASLINFAILMSSFPLSKLLGKRGLIAIERLSGMLLVLMSVDMIMGGIEAFVSR